MFESYHDVCGVEEAADMLRLKPYRIYQLIRDGKLRRLNTGKPYLIPKTELIRFVERFGLG